MKVLQIQPKNSKLKDREILRVRQGFKKQNSKQIKANKKPFFKRERNSLKFQKRDT